MAIQLIVGLGNPGPEYETTRHNAGFWFIDKLSQQSKLEKKFKGEVATANFENASCLLLKPLTYMNRSGEAVLAVANFYKIKPEEILVVHDELDLLPGSARLKIDGGHGGYNGLRDIIARLGTNRFYHLRIGIGHPGTKDDVHDYVLHRPSLSDKDKIFSAIDKALFVLPHIMQGKIEKAMNELHTEAK